MELRLNSPVGGLPAVYHWPLSKKRGYDESKEIIDTIVWGCKDIPDLSVPLKKNILKDVDVTNYESMKALTKRYNKAINNVLSLERGTQKFCDRLDQPPSKELLYHIIQQTYSSAVTNAEELNRYQAFSPDVYGETSFDLIAQMIDQINLTKDDVFIDLGSGVGQVILQVAATSFCKTCIGIERAEVPAKYAEAMEEKFKFWMQWYGKKFGNFKLIKGDFFDETHRDKFTEATVIFVNNFAFGPAIDHKLKQRFAELKHGTKIVSSKSFCPLNFRITDRNLSDIGTIMDISEIAPNTSSVSWTDKPVSYYLQVIDRTKLEKYFHAKKNNIIPSFTADETDTSSDSFETDSRTSSDKYTPPLKKRGRRSRKVKNLEPSTTTSIFKSVSSEIQNGYSDNSENITAQSGHRREIIRPSKLVLNKLDSITEEGPKKKRGKKRKEISRSCSPNFDSTNWVSQGKLRTYSRKSLDFSLGLNNLPPINSRYLTMQGNLKSLLDNFKVQYLQMVEEMSSPFYKIKIRKQIEDEIKRHKYLKQKIAQINIEIENIITGMQNQIFQATIKNSNYIIR